MSTRQSDQSSQEFFPPPSVARVGVATDLDALPVDSRVIETVDGFIVRTPSCPIYRSGNMTYLRRPPTVEENWPARAELAFSVHKAEHVQVAWEQPLGDERTIEVCQQLRSTFEVGVDHVMMLAAAERSDDSNVMADEPTATGERDIRELASDRDWKDLGNLSESVARDEGDESDFSAWMTRQIRRRVEVGRARWFGVWDGDTLVTSAGLATTSAGLLVEDVQTHPLARRRGHATAIVRAMLKSRRSEDPNNFVIVADAGSSAERIYNCLGFEPVSELVTATARRASSSTD